MTSTTPALQSARTDAVERADDLHAEILREPHALRAPAVPVHDDARGVVLAAGVPGAGDLVAEVLEARGLGTGGAGMAVAVQHHDADVAARASMPGPGRSCA